MFGCLVAGRLLQTNLQQIDETHALFELPAAESINHICVFLLGSVPFPEGYGATVHFFWPGKGFQLLGMLSNDKPSAIFRLRGNFNSNQTSNAHSMFESTGTEPQSPNSGSVTAVLGIAIEPLPQILQEVSTLPSAITPTRNSVADATIMAERIVKHLFNYVGGFTGGMMTPDTTVPLGIIARWYESFVGKVRVGGVGFLDNQE